MPALVQVQVPALAPALVQVLAPAVALVLVTIAAVAVAAHMIAPRIPWGAAFVLGTIVAPSDADVTTQIVRRLGLPAHAAFKAAGRDVVKTGGVDKSEAKASE